MDPTRQSFTLPLPQHCESRDALFTAQVVGFYVEMLCAAATDRLCAECVLVCLG